MINRASIRRAMSVDADRASSPDNDDDEVGGDDVPSSCASSCLCAPCAPLMGFNTRLRRVFGWQLLAFVFSADFFVKGAAKHLIASSFLPYAQKYLKFSAQAFQRFDVLVSFPWMLKPFLGVLTDTTPVFGYKKRAYLTFVSLCGTIAIFMIGSMTFHPEDGMKFAVLVTLVNTLIAFSDVLTGARLFEAMSLNQTSGGDLLTYSWMLTTIGAIVGTALSYIGLETGQYRMIYWFAFPCALQLVFTSAFGLLPEKKVPSDYSAHAMAKKHWNKFLLAFIITICSLGVIAIQLVSGIVDDFVTCFLCCVSIAAVLCCAIYWCLEKKVAMMLLYLFIDRFVNVNVSRAKMYWYTEGNECVPNGPHFGYVFFIVATFLVALTAQAIGIWLFQRYLARSNVRLVLLVSIVTKIIAKFTDIWIITRTNLRMGIGDHSAYVFSEGVIEGIAFILNYMPSSVVLAKFAEKDIESTLFTVLAGTVNVAQALAVTIGSSAMTFVGIHTDLVAGKCNFDQLIPLLMICGVVLPLFSVPFIYLLVPDINMHEDLSGSLDVKTETTSPATNKAS